MNRLNLIQRRSTAKNNILYFFGAFALISILVAINPSMVFEKEIFLWFYGWPSWFYFLFYTLTLLGSSWMFLVVATIVWFTNKRNYAIDVIAVGVVSYTAAQIMKTLINRPRPFELFGEVFHKEIFVTGLGYPSGHTAIATALALTIMPHLPKDLRWIAPVWIIGVGLSRVYLGVHLPLDVIGGFLLGTAVTLLIKYLRDLSKKRKLKEEV